jgi:thiamine pyrophosphate-dependent acetolactate synthase large subunit-like protein
MKPAMNNRAAMLHARAGETGEAVLGECMSLDCYEFPLSHQRVHLDQLFSPLTKRSLTLGTADSRELTSISIALALAPRPGPVHLALPSDVGSHKLSMGQFWRTYQAGTFFMSDGLSGMAFGISAWRAESLAAVRTEVERALVNRSPVVLEVPVDLSEYYELV